MFVVVDVESPLQTSALHRFISLLYLDLSLLYCMNVMARVRIEMEHLAGLVLYVRQSPDTDAVKD
jgi:hypothetical protein